MWYLLCCKSFDSSSIIVEYNQRLFFGFDLVDKLLIFQNFVGGCPKVTVDPVDPPTNTGEPNQCQFSYVDLVDRLLIFQILWGGGRKGV